MKSLRESFSIWTNKGPSQALGPPPKSAVGFLPHREEQQLAKLWSEMMRCEQGCRGVMGAVRQYSDRATAAQQEEEKLLSKLQEMAPHQTTPDLHHALEALDNLMPQLAPLVPRATDRLDSEVCARVREYHALYSQIDAIRCRKDALLAELHRVQDKLDKLRLKGKRSTDVLVERERLQQQLQEVQRQLLQEVTTYHNLRAAFLQHVLHCYADIQFLQYGDAAQQYKTHVVGKPAHQPAMGRLNDSTAQHLANIRALNITDE